MAKSKSASLQRSHKLLLAFTGVAFLALLTGYLTHWRLAFNADYVLSGLVANRLLKYGELPIFIGTIGYQGMLLEAGLMAPLIRFFGLTPLALNLAPSFYFALLCVVFFFSTRAWMGARVAAWSSFFLVLSPPAFYLLCARSQPNYSETFLLGFLLFWIYRVLLERPREAWALFAFGFVAGFGWYTYGQIYFFLLAIALHAALLYLRTRPRLWSAPTPAVWLCRVAIAVCGGLFFWTAALATDEIHLGRLVIRSTPLAFLCGAVALFFAQHFLAPASLRFFLRHRREAGLLLLGAFAGGFPRLYYTVVLGLPSASRTGTSGQLGDLWIRARYLVEYHASVWGASDWRLANFSLGAVVLGAGIAFGVWVFRQARQFVARGDRKILGSIPPLGFLPLVVIGLCLVSVAVTERNAARYSISLVFFLACALGWATDRLLARGKPVATIGGLLIVLIVGGTFSRAHWFTFRTAPARVVTEDLIEVLERRGIRYGVGDYWLSYPVAFLSQERIQIEPLYSAYSPHYREGVWRQKRIAYLEFASRAPNGRTVKLPWGEFGVAERILVGDVVVLVLEK